MTDRELLELIAQKVSGLDQKVTGLDQKVSGLEQKLTGLEQKVTGLDQKVTEHGEILQAVRHAQEIQKAEIDQVKYAVARVEGCQNETKRVVDRIAGDVSFLIRKTAEHDDDIRELRQAK